jgi:hypothetical protein
MPRTDLAVAYKPNMAFYEKLGPRVNEPGNDPELPSRATARMCLS